MQLMGTEPVLEQKEGPVRRPSSSKQGNLQQQKRSQRLAAAGQAPLVQQICKTGCQREQRNPCFETASSAWSGIIQ